MDLLCGEAGTASRASGERRFRLGASIAGVFLVVVVGAAAAWAFVLLYPQFAPAFPKCVFHEVSGLYCTGCGSTRALFALLSGDIAGAWAQNPLLVVVLPWLGWVGATRVVRTLAERLPSIPGRAHWLFAALVIAFTVLRNLPGFEFLGPRE